MYYLSDICFICIKEIPNLQPVFFFKIEDNTIHQIEHFLPEIMFLKSKLPTYICSTCLTKLNSSYTKVERKKICLDNYRRLKRFKKLLQGPSDIDLTNDDMKTVDLTKNETFDNKDEQEKVEQIDILNDEDDDIEIKEDIINFKSGDLKEYKLILSNVQSGNQDETISNIKALKNYECSVCNKKFNRENNLRNHEKIHSENKDLKCSICNKQFLHKYYLAKHIKNHSGTKHLDCTKCNKTFYWQIHLNRHMKLHYKIKTIT